MSPRCPPKIPLPRHCPLAQVRTRGTGPDGTLQEGAFSHSANYFIVHPGNTPENHPITEGCMINSKQHRGCRIQDPGTRVATSGGKQLTFCTAHGAPQRMVLAFQDTHRHGGISHPRVPLRGLGAVSSPAGLATGRPGTPHGVESRREGNPDRGTRATKRGIDLTQPNPNPPPARSASPTNPYANQTAGVQDAPGPLGHAGAQKCAQRLQADGQGHRQCPHDTSEAQYQGKPEIHDSCTQRPRRRAIHTPTNKHRGGPCPSLKQKQDAPARRREQTLGHSPDPVSRAASAEALDTDPGISKPVRAACGHGTPALIPQITKCRVFRGGHRMTGSLNTTGSNEALRPQLIACNGVGAPEGNRAEAHGVSTSWDQNMQIEF